MEKWIKNKSENVFENGFFDIEKHSCENVSKGVKHDFYVVNTYNWVNIVAVTREGKMVLVKQHRLGSDEISLETPGGVVETGEHAADCAERELLEETGYKGERAVLLNESWVNPAIMSNRISFFLIEDCEKVQGQSLDPAEDIEVVEYGPDDVMAMIRSGEINHSIVINILALYFLHSGRTAGIIPGN